MKKNILRQLALLLAVLLVPVSLCADNAGQRRKHLPNVNIAIPFHRADTVPTAFHLGLLGSFGSQRGVGIELLGSMVKGDVQGLQIGGLMNIAGGNQTGMQLGALVNHVTGQGSGLQLGLIVNSAHTYRGLQLSSLSNVAVVTSGVQVGVLNNVVCETMKGVQFTGISNVAVEVAGGVQVSAVANVAQRDLRGMQLSVFNYAGGLRGCQAGVVNMCDHSRGWQVGVVNYSVSPSRRKIGLVNLDSLTRVQYLLLGGNTAKAGGGVRLLGSTLYTEVGVGTQWLGLDEEFSGCLFYRKGALLRLNRHFSLPVDLGFAHIESFDNNSPEVPERMYGLQARAGLEWNITPRLFLQAMTGYGITRHYNHDATYNRKVLFEVGLLFEGR